MEAIFRRNIYSYYWCLLKPDSLFLLLIVNFNKVLACFCTICATDMNCAAYQGEVCYYLSKRLDFIRLGG